MLIPYGSDQPFYRRPWVTYALLLINFLVLVYEKTLGPRSLLEFLQNFAFIPAEFSLPTLFTSLFVHAGIIHFLGNMWFLALVAPVVEDRFGHIKFSLIYLLGGILGTLFQTLFIPAEASAIKIFGSSGSVFSVIGAYTILYPYSHIKVFYFFTFYWARIYSGTWKIPALIVWGFYFILNTLKLGIVPAASIAYGAHSAGFVVGAVAAAAFFGLRQFIGKEDRAKEALVDFPAKKIFFPQEEKEEGAEITEEKARTQLLRLVFMGDAEEVEKYYSEVVAQFPEFVLQPGPQFDLGRFLAKHNKFALALHAFERLIETAPEVPVGEQSLLEAGRLCLTVPGKLEQGLDYLQRFIKGEISSQQYQEASQLIQLIQSKLVVREKEIPEQIKEVKEMPEVSSLPAQAVRDMREQDEIDLELEKEAESKPLVKPKIIAPITEEQTAAPEISETLQKPETRNQKPAEIDWQQAKYFLIIPRKEQINYELLAEAIANYRQIELPEAEWSLIIGKGIVLRDLPFEAAVKIQQELRKRGQNIYAVVADEHTLLPPPIDVKTCWLYSDYLQVKLETQEARQRYRWQDIIFLSCGSIDVEPGQGAFKSILDFVIFATDSPQLLRIWETTFDFKASNLPLKIVAQENFLMLVKEFCQRSSRAVITPVLREMVRQEALSPRQFATMEIYENYSLWYYLSHFGKQLPNI